MAYIVDFTNVSDRGFGILALRPGAGRRARQ